MNRARRYLQSLGANALLLGLNAIYTLVSVPIALHFLTTEEFGLWIVISQVAAYLSMIDLGTSAAGVRLLIDHKDQPESDAYGGLIKATVLAQIIQAAAIFLIGAGLVPFLATWLKVPDPLARTFNALWIWQVGLLSLSFSTRITVQLLSAHQRLDVVNYSQAAGLMINFVVTLIFFKLAFGIYSLALGQSAAALVAVVWTVAATKRLKLFPRRWGGTNRGHWRSLFGFGSEMFLVALGTQFINSSQTFLLTRLQGLEAASVWSVMTKTFTLLTQLAWRIIGVALPAFSEMLVRGEHERLRQRYKTVFQISLLTSCFFGFLIASGNSGFVILWTHGRVQWQPVNDWLLAVWFVLLTQVYCHNSLIINTKRLQGLKYIYLMEGAVFVAACVLVIPSAGITGMLACSIICTALFTLSYGTSRAGRLLGLDQRGCMVRWLMPAIKFSLLVLPPGVVLGILTSGSPVLQLVACALPIAVIAPIIAIRWCVPPDLTDELISHLPDRARRPARAIAGSV